MRCFHRTDAPSLQQEAANFGTSSWSDHGRRSTTSRSSGCKATEDLFAAQRGRSTGASSPRAAATALAGENLLITRPALSKTKTPCNGCCSTRISDFLTHCTFLQGVEILDRSAPPHDQSSVPCSLSCVGARLGAGHAGRNVVRDGAPPTARRGVADA